MIKRRPYQSYKDTQLQWIGIIPEHWTVGPFKNLVSIQNGADYKDVEAEEGCPVIGSGGAFAFSSKAMYEGETVLLGRKGTIDKPLYYKGAFWAVDTMYWSKIPPSVNGRFAYYNATTIPFAMYATRTALPSMTKSTLGAHLVAYPEKTEQDQIARWLDRETARIDTLIAKKTRFIELLKEKRQAVIAKAVTKGLDDSVEMKDSRVKWLGLVPNHWVVAQLSRVTQSRCDGPFGSGLKSHHYTSDGVRVVRLQNIGFAEFKNDNAAFVSYEHWEETLGRGHAVTPGDLLIAGLGDDNNPLGRACTAPEEIGDALVKADCYRFRLDPQKAFSKFFAFLLSATSKAECGFMATGATRDRLNLGLASSRVVAFPPSVEEQKAIVAYIESKVRQINLLLSRTERSIEFLKEHRAALITSAVTGKIDVREAA